MSVCFFPCQFILVGLGYLVLNVLLSLPFLPLEMLPRLLFRLFMAPGLLKLIATRRPFFVLIRILLGRVNSAMMSFFPPCYLNLMECVADLWSGLS